MLLICPKENLTFSNQSRQSSQLFDEIDEKLTRKRQEKECYPMYPTRWMRLLRLKHRVTHRELAEAAQVSRQRIIEIELGTDYTTEYQRQLVAKAFRSVIEKRGLDGCSLEKDWNPGFWNTQRMVKSCDLPYPRQLHRCRAAVRPVPYPQHGGGGHHRSAHPVLLLPAAAICPHHKYRDYFSFGGPHGGLCPHRPGGRQPFPVPDCLVAVETGKKDHHLPGNAP